jgi:hypothetical protein
MDAQLVNSQTRSLKIVKVDARQGIGETNKMIHVLRIVLLVNMVMRLPLKGLAMSRSAYQLLDFMETRCQTSSFRSVPQRQNYTSLTET